MTIREYLQDKVFQRRAEKGCLTVYDPARRYREILLSMNGGKTRVIDASTSIIEQREEAVASLSDLANGTIHKLILWLPTAAPGDDEAKQKDPFSFFAALGDYFPRGDGDEFPEICRRAKPDHVSEINRLFLEGEPTFQMIDALDEGGSWPMLKTLLQVNSPKEILLGILSPKDNQANALKNNPSWIGEARDFVKQNLGHRLKTKGQTRQSIADELWRVALFSEFIFDLTGEIPASLETVPRAGDESRGLVYEICDDLRRHDDHKDTYKTVAMEVEEELLLADRTADMNNLGLRDTFSFEERFYLRRLVDLACQGDFEGAQKIWLSRERSIWLSQQERLAEWTLAVRALELIESARRLATPKFSSLESIVNGYALTWREIDRRQREMEQAQNQMQDDHESLDRLVRMARDAYLRSVEALQAEFIRLVKLEGWPVTGEGVLWNRQLFSKVVAPLMDDGKRVAYFLVDSLRYELGAELEKQLSDEMKVSLHPVCAQLPTYTEVGMASLMPDAESNLLLTSKNEKLVTTLGGKTATNPATRFAYLQSKKGDQCQDIELDELIRKTPLKIPEKVKLLVVRTRDLDSIAHDSPHQVLDVIPNLVREIIRGIGKAAALGFDSAVIATDHGFLLYPEQEAGNVAPKPAGNWAVQKSRCLLGDGDSDSFNLVMPAQELGIPGEIKKFAAPVTLVPYHQGQLYYHEGLSLQECVLPCLIIRLEPPKQTKKKQRIQLILSYRQGKTDRISTRRPVIDLECPVPDFFAEDVEREVVIEAVDSKGDIVAWAGTGQSVNPATGGVRIKPGLIISVGLKVKDDFSGKFTVRALDQTSNALLAELSLKTAYLE